MSLACRSVVGICDVIVASGIRSFRIYGQTGPSVVCLTSAPRVKRERILARINPLSGTKDDSGRSKDKRILIVRPVLDLVRTKTVCHCVASPWDDQYHKKILINGCN